MCTVTPFFILLYTFERIPIYFPRLGKYTFAYRVRTGKRKQSNMNTRIHCVYEWLSQLAASQHSRVVIRCMWEHFSEAFDERLLLCTLSSTLRTQYTLPPASAFIYCMYTYHIHNIYISFSLKSNLYLYILNRQPCLFVQWSHFTQFEMPKYRPHVRINTF